ncbi:MAG: DUF2062 domain-containing protein [Desulfuromonas sp.]|uniref:DUF2062 domain-containing protein n=1 Tax=Desulfuromonas sp. TaxID=892 RepID=UPI000CC59467|nr:DUF2062 domain-containing protein [Desulfuromonas sp.]PLX85187.1 MAG: DUF2062 domain-containing protein [Desulfuromonas sp.]
MWKRLGLIRQGKLGLLRFVRLRGSPEEIAKGLALGIFIGMTTTFGIQMVLAVFFAMLLRENKLAAILGVWISNPVTAPFIYALEYEAGRSMLGLERVRLPDEFTFSALKTLGWDVLAPLWIGSLVCGLICGALCFALTLRTIPSVRAMRIPRWPRRPRKG